MAKKKLTDKQQRFVEEYMIDLNATQAAIRAGYSKKTADRIGPELLGKTWVAEAIKAKQRKVSDELSITRDDCIRGLHEIAIDKKSPSAARTTAWTTLSKMLGHLVEKRSVEHSGEVSHKHELSQGLKDKLDAIYQPNRGE